MGQQLILLMACTLALLPTTGRGETPGIPITKPRVDCYGDPLPPGAVARLGTARMRCDECVAFSPDGRTLAVADDTGLRLFDVRTKRLLHKLPDQDTFAFAPDGKVLAGAGAEGIIVLWDVATGRENKTLRDHEGGVRDLCFSQDGRLLASGGSDHTVLLWDLGRGK